jgi:acyl carrier protein phosphodiesterase
MGVRRWMFFHPNDGTVPYPNNDDNNNILWERIQELEDNLVRIRDENTRLNIDAARLRPTDIQVVRDEQVIVRDWVQHIQDTESYLGHIRREQATRMALRLLESDLIDHVLTAEEPNGNYISRMTIRVQNNL